MTLVDARPHAFGDPAGVGGVHRAAEENTTVAAGFSVLNLGSIRSAPAGLLPVGDARFIVLGAGVTANRSSRTNGGSH